jgi:ABC-type multidrug transport system ATPase subunit
MKISCTKTGKRFNRDWIFRDFNYEFIDDGNYAIIGPNGSGKSTLLQVIAGAVVSSEGTISYLSDDLKQIVPDEAFNAIAIAAPYLEVIEEMTFTELLHFHQIFKPFLPGVSISDIVEIVGLKTAAHKQIRYYSSGMKQRVKLAQAIFSNTCCLLLDEPCTNLDDAGIQLYHRLINEYCKNRLIIVSSNDVQEYSFCDRKVSILSYK